MSARASDPANGFGRHGRESELPGLRNRVTLGVAVVLVALIGVGGSRLPVEMQARNRPTAPVVGRTSAVCTAGTTGTLQPNGTSSGGTSSTGTGDDVRTVVTAVSARQATSGSGSVVGRVLTGKNGDQGDARLRLSTAGAGVQLKQPAGSLLLTAEGAMATGAAGAVVVRADQGRERGLQSAPCVLPVVNQWLVGLGASQGVRDTIVLSNPDATDAEVDLRLYGTNGPVTAAGASGITVPAGSARAVSLSALTQTGGPIAVNVRASSGRVAAVAQELRTTGDAGDPAGADLHPSSVGPARRQLIPGVPGGPGTRTLTVVNPGLQRAKVGVEILGPEGPFAPAGAAELTLGPQSTGQVDLTAGLGGQIGTVRLTSDQPVTGAVTSISTDAGDTGTTGGTGGTGTGNTDGSGTAAADLAVTTAQPLLGRTAIAPAAIAADAGTQLAISNAGSTGVVVGLTVYDLDGVSLYHEEVPVGPNATAARRLDQPAPAYLVLTVPDRSEVYAGTTLSGTLGSGADQVAALASTGLVTPDPDARSRTVVDDPRVAR